MSLLIGYTGAILGYLIPLSIIYNFAYSRAGNLMSLFWILFFTYLTGVLACLLYYRMGVLHESAEIANISNEVVKSIMATNAASYTLVAITLFAISFNKGLVNIFENTLGYLYIQMFGANKFANEIFSSEKFGKESDLTDFNYGFLLTRFSTQNIREFLEQMKVGDKNYNNTLPLDFRIHFENQEQVQKLEDYVYTKHRIGHFTWVYFTSIIALVISMVSIAMKY